MKKTFFLALCLVLGLPLLANAVEAAPSGEAEFYQDYKCETGGNSFTLAIGEYADLRNNTMESGGTWNDQISCMTIGAGVSRVIIYEHINFKGKSKSFTKATNNPLGCWSLAKDWWNDKTSSIKVQ